MDELEAEKEKAVTECIEYAEAEKTFRGGISYGRAKAFSEIIEKLGLLLKSTREQQP